MDKQKRQAIQLECRDLVWELAQATDHGQYDEAIKYYAPDAVWMRAGKAMKGQAEILRALKDRLPSHVARHVVSNIKIDVKDDSHAEGVTYYIAFTGDSGQTPPKLPIMESRPFSMGEWHDRYVLTKEGWKLAYRETRRLFERAGGH
jgi:ketosteroid isomerase-like protein